MGTILKSIEKHIETAVETIGVPKDKFDTLITSFGWVILAYVIIKNINKKQEKKDV